MVQVSYPYMTTRKSRKVKVKLLSCVRLFATPWTVAYTAPLSMGFSRQEYWSGLPFPSPGDLPNPGIEPRSPTLQADALSSEPPGKPVWSIWHLTAKWCLCFFNMLSSFVVAFLSRSKCLLISWLISQSSDFGTQENKIFHCFHFCPINLSWSDGTKCHDLSFLNVEFKANLFTLLFHIRQETLQFLFTSCHYNGIIYISQVVAISLSNLDSSLWAIQPGISHDILCM